MDSPQNRRYEPSDEKMDLVFLNKFHSVTEAAGIRLT